jgi:hypothetical protein
MPESGSSRVIFSKRLGNFRFSHFKLTGEFAIYIYIDISNREVQVKEDIWNLTRCSR